MLSLYSSHGQNDTVHFEINFTFNKEDLQLNKYYLLNGTDSVEINTLKFYISAISLLHNGETVWKEANSFHLIDAELNKSTKFDLAVKEGVIYDKFRFNLGIDSLTNVSGAMGNDLDPSKNMYWTWQSGYINFKLEGRSNVCLARKNEFKFHLGGYQFPYNCIQQVEFTLPQPDLIHLQIDLAEIISELRFGELDHIMSPSFSAMELSSSIAKKIRLRIP